RIENGELFGGLTFRLELESVAAVERDGMLVVGEDTEPEGGVSVLGSPVLDTTEQQITHPQAARGPVDPYRDHPGRTMIGLRHPTRDSHRFAVTKRQQIVRPGNTQPRTPAVFPVSVALPVRQPSPECLRRPGQRR